MPKMLFAQTMLVQRIIRSARADADEAKAEAVGFEPTTFVVVEVLCVLPESGSPVFGLGTSCGASGVPDLVGSGGLTNELASE